MDAAERKRLIKLNAENKKIAEAVAEEKRILASKPIYYMPKDDSLARLPKSEAVKIIHKRRENVAKGMAVMNETVIEHPAIATKEEADKIDVEDKPKKRGRSKKVE